MKKLTFPMTDMRMRKVLKLLFLLLAFLMSDIAAAQKGNYEVKVRNANVRATPSTKSAIVGTLSAGTVVKVKAIENGWASFSYQGRTCYVSAKLLKEPIATMRQENEETTRPRASRSMPAYPNHQQPTASTYRSNTNAETLSGLRQTERKALWRFDLSAMPQGGLSDYGYSSVINISAMLGGDFPVNWFGNRGTIEAGVRFLYRKAFLNKDDDLMTDNNYVEIPARLAYDLPLNENLSLRVGAGPYVSFGLSNGEGLSMGVEPALSLKYKNFSAGLQYSASLSSGNKSSKSNVVMVNLAIRFGSKAWTAIGKGILAAGNVSEAIIESGFLDNYSNKGKESYNGSYTEESEEDGGDGQILISSEIDKLQKEISQMRRAPIDYSGVIRIREKEIEWLQKQQSQGRKYVSKEEYREFKDKKKEARDKAQKSTLEEQKRRGEKSKKVFESKSNL